MVADRPQIIESASPRLTINAAMMVLEDDAPRATISGVTPSRPISCDRSPIVAEAGIASGVGDIRSQCRADAQACIGDARSITADGRSRIGRAICWSSISGLGGAQRAFVPPSAKATVSAAGPGRR